MKEEIKIIFTGTGSGKTSLKRYHSSFLINTSGYNLLVDAGDGISKALLSQRIDYNIIDGILLSHLHPDHYTGLPSLLVQMKMNKREKELSIFVSENLIEFVNDFIYKSYLFINNFEFEINFASIKNDEVFSINKNFSFLPKQNSHLDKYSKFDKEKKLSNDSFSFLFKINENNIFYTGDIAKNEDLYLFNDFKINYMICEITHINFEEIILAYQQQKIEKLFLTHVNDEDENQLKKIIGDKDSIILIDDGYIASFKPITSAFL